MRWAKRLDDDDGMDRLDTGDLAVVALSLHHRWAHWQHASLVRYSPYPHRNYTERPSLQPSAHCRQIGKSNQFEHRDGANAALWPARPGTRRKVKTQPVHASFPSG